MKKFKALVNKNSILYNINNIFQLIFFIENPVKNKYHKYIKRNKTKTNKNKRYHSSIK